MDKNEMWDKVENGVFHFDEENKELVGEYLGSEPEGKFKDSVVHRIKTEDSIVSFFGSTILNRLLHGLESKIVKVVYLGSDKTEKGNDIKLFEVYQKK